MADIKIQQGLPFVRAQLIAQGKSLTVENVILDTGSAHCIFRTDDLEQLGIQHEPSDTIRTMFGVGGVEYVIEKEISALRVGDLSVSPFTIQIGAVNYGMDINGILGLDFLLATKAQIDLDQLVITV